MVADTGMKAVCTHCLFGEGALLGHTWLRWHLQNLRRSPNQFEFTSLVNSVREYVGTMVRGFGLVGTMGRGFGLAAAVPFPDRPKR